MKAWTAWASLAVCIGFTAFTVAAERPERLDKALKERYGNDVQAKIVGTPREINGIRVYQVEIRGASDREASDRNASDRSRNSTENQSTAQVTEFGDFLASGAPIAFRRLPEPVQQVKELFRSAPVDADSFVADSYYFDVKQGSEDRLYRMRYDAVGRLRQIINPQEVERTETTHFQPASGSVEKKIEVLARRDAPRDAKLKNVYKDPRYAGFYVAKYAKDDGKEFLVTLNDDGDIYATRDEVDMRDIPGAIRDSFDKMFDTSKVKWVYKVRDKFGQFQQKTETGELVTFRVRPDGTIMDVRNEAVNPADEKAVTATHRETPTDTRTRNTRDHGPDQ